MIQTVKGNLRFPLDFTYHGCPFISHNHSRPIFCLDRLLTWAYTL